MSFKEDINRIIEAWEEDTMFLSYHDVDHPAFTVVQKIRPEISVPIILEIIRAKKTWFYIVLDKIVPEEDQPVFPKETQGKIDDQIDIWIKWGIERRLIERKVKDV
jgi:hypothetical protein